MCATINESERAFRGCNQSFADDELVHAQTEIDMVADARKVQMAAIPGATRPGTIADPNRKEVDKRRTFSPAPTPVSSGTYNKDGRACYETFFMKIHT